MSDHLDKFVKVFKAFEKENVDYILVGGFAVILYGMQRLTRDIDIFVKMVPENIERLRRALASVYSDESIEEITLQELKEYAVIRYGAPDGFCVDILSRPGEMATYEDLEFRTVSLHGTSVKVATPETLFRLKRDTVRPEDKVDAGFLEELLKNAKVQ